MRRVGWNALAVAIAAAVLVGCAAVQPGRSVGRELDDVNASLQIKASMLRSEGYALGGVDVEVTEGVALLSGTVPRDTDRLQAECLAWAAPAVRSVANELSVGSARGARDAARDAWITQQVRSRLLTDRDVRSVNFNVETHDSIVYLLGFARTVGERDRASSHAALVDGVERVVVLVRVADEAPDIESRGARLAEMCDVQSSQGSEAVIATDDLLGGPTPEQ